MQFDLNITEISNIQSVGKICSYPDEILNFCKHLNFDTHFSGVFLIAVSIMLLIFYFVWIKYHYKTKLNYNQCSVIAIWSVRSSLYFQLAFFVWFYYFRK